MLKLLDKIQFNCSITFNSLKFNWLSLAKNVYFLTKFVLKKRNRQKKHALVLPRQNVTLGKMLLGNLELGKKLPRQNFT